MNNKRTIIAALALISAVQIILLKSDAMNSLKEFLLSVGNSDAEQIDRFYIGLVNALPVLLQATITCMVMSLIFNLLHQSVKYDSRIDSRKPVESNKICLAKTKDMDTNTDDNMRKYYNYEVESDK
jgi:hypothetical protein